MYNINPANHTVLTPNRQHYIESYYKDIILPLPSYFYSKHKEEKKTQQNYFFWHQNEHDQPREPSTSHVLVEELPLPSP